MKILFNIKTKFASIKHLIWIYIIFVLLLIASLLGLNIVNRNFIESMLISNTESQLTLMNTKFDEELEGAQTSLTILMSSAPLISVLNQDEDRSSLNTLRKESDLKYEMRRTLNYVSVFGALDAYMPATKRLLTTRTASDTDISPLLRRYRRITRPGWYYFKNKGMYYVTMYPLRSSREELPYTFMVAGKLQQDYILKFISGNNIDTKVTSYFDQIQGDSTIPRTVNTQIQKRVRDNRGQSGKIVRKKISVDNREFQVMTIFNARAHAYFVSYFDRQSIAVVYQPISSLLIGIIVLLLSVAIIISILFYVRVYRNLETLIKYFRLIKKGDLSIRIPIRRPTEFAYVFENFNEMMSNTQNLIEQITIQTDLRQRAEYRQLQSQINPHFLYNCFSFIMSMAEYSPRAVIAMTDNLANYYRYRTKVDIDHVTVDDELAFVGHYLAIMQLRKSIDFSIAVDEVIRRQSFISLILQPIVENAVAHGIEGRQGARKISISGTIKERGFEIAVSDDGIGMSNQQIEQVQHRLTQPDYHAKSGVGLWNANQRLISKYGKMSGLHFQQDQPGLSVLFWIPFD